jgi:hypothetical protein
MKYFRPKPTRSDLVDIVVLDQKGQIWLQQAKKTAPEWMLLRRHAAKTDTLGPVHEELTRAGFIVHEIAVLREGEIFWSENGKPVRMRHKLVLAGVNVGEAPEAKDFYFQAFEYDKALKLKQQYSNDLKQLYDPTIDVMVKRQKLWPQ